VLVKLTLVNFRDYLRSTVQLKDRTGRKELRILSASTVNEHQRPQRNVNSQRSHLEHTSPLRLFSVLFRSSLEI